jgi:hypothetical protein
MRHLRHIWEQLCSIIDDKLRAHPAGQEAADQPQATAQLDATLGAFDQIEQLCRDAIFHIGWRTIPERLRFWLNYTSAGSCISFHEAFDDEMPDQDLRVKMLTLLAAQPARIPGGLVDVQAGVIYKYSKRRGWQIGSLLAVTGSMVAFTAIAALAGNVSMPPLPGFIDGKYGMPIFLGWLAVLVGVAFHLAADAFKREKDGGTSGARTVTSVNPVKWINARFWHLALRISIIVAGYAGGIFMFYDQSLNALIVSMFLVGYGLDSFVGIFTTSVEQRAAAQAKQTLTPGVPASA